MKSSLMMFSRFMMPTALCSVSLFSSLSSSFVFGLPQPRSTSANISGV
jgi:hypothetical protein